MPTPTTLPKAFRLVDLSNLGHNGIKATSLSHWGGYLHVRNLASDHIRSGSSFGKYLRLVQRNPELKA